MNIRTAHHNEAEQIRDIYRLAFPPEEKKIVSQLAVDLLTEEQAFSLVAESGGSLLGHVTFSRFWPEGDETIGGYLLAPLAVHPDHQKQGLGSALVTAGIKRLTAEGVPTVLVYGDPKYYGKFGFDADTAERYFTPPYTLQYPFGWQALTLKDKGLRYKGLRDQELRDQEPGGQGEIKSKVKVLCVRALDNPSLW